MADLVSIEQRVRGNARAREIARLQSLIDKFMSEITSAADAFTDIPLPKQETGTVVSSVVYGQEYMTVARVMERVRFAIETHRVPIAEARAVEDFIERVQDTSRPPPHY